MKAVGRPAGAAAPAGWPCAQRAEYATAGIPEYWIVDPRDESIMVLALLGAAYQEHGRYVRGDTARSVGLPDFAVSVADVFDAE